MDKYNIDMLTKVKLFYTTHNRLPLNTKDFEEGYLEYWVVNIKKKYLRRKLNKDFLDVITAELPELTRYIEIDDNIWFVNCRLFELWIYEHLQIPSINSADEDEVSLLNWFRNTRYLYKRNELSADKIERFDNINPLFLNSDNPAPDGKKWILNRLFTDQVNEKQSLLNKGLADNTLRILAKHKVFTVWNLYETIYKAYVAMNSEDTKYSTDGYKDAIELYDELYLEESLKKYIIINKQITLALIKCWNNEAVYGDVILLAKILHKSMLDVIYDSEVDSTEVHQRLRNTISDLRNKDKVIILLRYYSLYTFREIGSIFNSSKELAQDSESKLLRKLGSSQEVTDYLKGYKDVIKSRRELFIDSDKAITYKPYTSIDELKLSVRARNALCRAGLLTIYDLAKLLSTEEGKLNLFRIRSIGDKTVNEILSKYDEIMANYDAEAVDPSREVTIQEKCESTDIDTAEYSEIDYIIQMISKENMTYNEVCDMLLHFGLINKGEVRIDTCSI